jgi:hypothetical protein
MPPWAHWRQQIMNKNVLYYGRDQALPELIALKAGPLSLYLEGGGLRYIRFGDREILRRVYVAVRDRNWGTVPPELSQLQIEAGVESFQISYEVENRQAEIDFRWRGTISGTAEGTVGFRMEGQARSTFMRNRIGFCVLHPMRECAGEPCRVEHDDGTIVEGSFPVYISPHQPFKRMRAISHRVTEDLEAEVRFEGEVFEMEDQRNWTDASFKTYCTPLELPFPVEVKAGTEIAQSVTLTLKGAGGGVGRIGTGDERPLTVRVSETGTGRLPRLGLETAAHESSLSRQEIERLKALHLSHLRAELKLSRPDWKASLARAGKESQALGVELELAVFLSGKSEQEVLGQLQSLRGVLDAGEFPICTWLIFHRDEKSKDGRWIELARKSLLDYRKQALLASGTDAYFTELNRERPPLQDLDLLCYSLNPQVHAFDNRSLAETLEAQATTVESARQFSGDRPIAVSPVTLRPRYNPNATGPEPEVGPKELPPQVDPRQMSLFGAGWTLGSLKYLGASAARSVTYYRTIGWRGVMESASGADKPALFPSIPGSVFPLYHVLADVGEWKDATLLSAESSDTLRVEALALGRSGGRRILLANLGQEHRRVEVFGMGAAGSGGATGVRFLDERTAQKAMTDPEKWRNAPLQRIEGSGSRLTVELLPFAVACIDTQ